MSADPACELLFAGAWTPEEKIEALRKQHARCAADLITWRDRAIEAVAVLREVQWSACGELPDREFCPACARHQEDGHAPDCRLAKVIA